MWSRHGGVYVKGFMINWKINPGVLYEFSKLQTKLFSFPPKGFFRTGFSKPFSDFEGKKTPGLIFYPLPVSLAFFSETVL